MRRLYFLIPTVDSAKTIVDELLLARVEQRHMHIAAADHHAGPPTALLHPPGVRRRSDPLLVGPWLPDPDRPGKVKRAKLFLFMDDHSRRILHGRFSFDEGLPYMELVFRRAVQKYGLPGRVYFDNGKVYRANHIKHLAAELAGRKLPVAITEKDAVKILPSWTRGADLRVLGIEFLAQSLERVQVLHTPMRQAEFFSPTLGYLNRISRG